MKSSILCLLLFLAYIPCQAAEHLPIAQIQGAALRSPLEGNEVSTEGIVTTVYNNGFIIQSTKPDSSPATSEAIYIYQEDTTVLQGNELKVTGVVEEWVPGGEE